MWILGKYADFGRKYLFTKILRCPLIIMFMVTTYICFSSLIFILLLI